ncbi:MAG: TIGR00730 family Rossman fold protein [Anaerolineales bacterium]|nr:TIGR00730 family Rossman fold protein [Anaerolineales bacterium]
MKTICIYCGSSDKLHTDYLDAAYEVGTLLAGRGLTLVFGAGKTGLMGALADGVLENGGEVVGVIPRQFYTPALVHTALTRLEVVEDMHTRKARMAELADGFIALPGGFGTFEEFFEILTWAQVGLHQKPVGLLNLRHYFDPLLALVENARREGFIYPEHQSLFLHSEQPEALLEAMERYIPPPDLARWVDRDG